MTVKGLEENGIAFAHEAAPAIVWAVNSGAHIINMSWGRNDDPGNLILAAIQHADSLGVVLVAATGNENKDFVKIGKEHEKHDNFFSGFTALQSFLSEHDGYFMVGAAVGWRN